MKQKVKFCAFWASKFQASQDYILRPCLKNRTKQNKQTKKQPTNCKAAVHMLMKAEKATCVQVASQGHGEGAFAQAHWSLGYGDTIAQEEDNSRFPAVGTREASSL